MPDLLLLHSEQPAARYKTTFIEQDTNEADHIASRLPQEYRRARYLQQNLELALLAWADPLIAHCSDSVHHVRARY